MNMRRSKSFSNIPMPLLNKRESKVLKRSKSTLRVSREPSLDGRTPLNNRAGTSITPVGRSLWSDPKYKTTPYDGIKRTGSVSSFGSRVSITKNRSPYEKKATQQKLINDKKWVAEQYSKVHAFVEQSGLFNAELAGMLRPPTISTFVSLVSVLFNTIIKTDPINSQNYADICVTTLKLLGYPGTLTMSTLKTVNTMHGWPHFISIISWIIDRANLGGFFSNFIEEQPEESKQIFDMQESILEFLGRGHSIFSAGDEQLLEESEQKLCQEISAGVRIDQEAAKNLEQPLKTFQITVSKLDSILEEIRDEIQELLDQNLERQGIIKKFKESTSTEEEDLANELLKLTNVFSKLKENKKDLLRLIQELETVVESQSCRYEEKIDILEKSEELQREIERKKRKITEYMAVRAKLDYELKNMVTQIEAKVDDWNVTITKSLLPEIKPLKLREKGFHSKQFLEELEEINNKKEELQKHLLNECSHILGKMEKLQKETESFKKSYQEVVKTRNQLDLKELVQRLKDDYLNLISSLDEVIKKNVANEIEIEHSEGSRLKIEETELAGLDDGIEKVTNESEKAAKKGVSVLVEARNLAFQFIKKIDNNMCSVLQDLTEKSELSRRNLMETHDYFLNIQKKTTENCEELPKENKENNSL